MLSSHLVADLDRVCDHLIVLVASRVRSPGRSAACGQAVNSSGGGPAGLDCLVSHGIRIGVTYQPASRYWPLQWAETGIYFALALALAGYCFRRIRRLS